jgi:hypothetical protein
MQGWDAVALHLLLWIVVSAVIDFVYRAGLFAPSKPEPKSTNADFLREIR